MHLSDFLAQCSVAPEVFELRPDYRALLVAVSGLEPAMFAARDEHVTSLVAAAEQHAQELLQSSPVTELPHIAAWREAYRAFGAKPQRTRNSLEALTRRAEAGLPRVGTLTDIYNALSVLHQIPLGGEDLTCYQGPAHLLRATGTEPFPTMAQGEPVVEHPAAGEVVWTTGGEVTCRRWNWRQGVTTALTENTTTVLFICDALAPLSAEQLQAVGQALIAELEPLGSKVIAEQRLLTKAE